MKYVFPADAKLTGRAKGQVTISLVTCDNVCRAVPGAQIVLPGDEITFENMTRDEMILFFPRLELFTGLKGRGHTIRVPAGGTEVLTVSQDLTNHDVYEYAMFCGGMKRFALGGSNPELIIGP